MKRNARFFVGIALICLLWIALVFAGSQQTSSTLASTIITDARYLLNEDVETTTGRWEDDELLKYLNQGIMNLVARTRAMQTVEEVTLATGTVEYALSIAYIDVETVMYDNTPDEVEYGLTRIKPRDIGREGEKTTGGPPQRYYLWNDNIGIDPMPTTDENGNTVTVYMAERPAVLVSTDNVPTPAHFDHLLVYYVAGQALMADRQFAKANYYLSLWNVTLDRFRADFDNPEVAEEVSK